MIDHRFESQKTIQAGSKPFPTHLSAQDHCKEDSDPGHVPVWTLCAMILGSREAPLTRLEDPSIAGNIKGCW